MASKKYSTLKTFNFVDFSLFVVVLFGLCGAFFSDMSSLPKIHYLPLLLAIGVAIARAANQKNSVKYFLATVLIIVSPFFASDTNAYLSYFSTIVLPIFWFGAGRYIHPESLAKWLFALSGILFLGLLLEVSNVIPGMFPHIGVKLGDESAQRYGSFAFNPLALGYFASMSGALFLLIRSRPIRYIGVVISILLLGAANSRGGMVTFALTLLLFWIFSNQAAFGPKRLGRSLRYSIYVLVTGIAISLTMSNPRLSSMFDWTGDEGNLGRLNQWGYCLAKISSNPLLGLGAGAMSPIGIGDDPYIEEGIVKSCDSTLLKIGVEYNSIAAIVYFLTIAFLIAKAIPKHPKISLLRPKYRYDMQYRASISIICSVFLQQLFNQTLESVWIGAVFFTLLGYCHSRLEIKRLASRKLPSCLGAQLPSRT